MDREQARRVLGVDKGLAPQELKRAYLRKVKLHPPERDPEQFENVRKAYEALSSAPFLDQVMAGVETNAESVAAYELASPSAETLTLRGAASRGLEALHKELEREGLSVDGLLRLLSDADLTERDAACSAICEYLW